MRTGTPRRASALVALVTAIGLATSPDPSGAGSRSHPIVAQWRNEAEEGIAKIDPKTGSVTTVALGSGVTSPRWSPNGRLISWRDEEGDDDGELYVARADGKRRRMVTDDEHDDYDQVWSPKSNRLAYVGWTATRSEIFVVDLRTGEVTRLTRNDRPDWHPDWSPKGGLIAFTRSNDHASFVYTVLPDGDRQRRLTRGMAPRFSADGTRILFSRGGKGPFQNDLFVMRADGTRIRRLTRSDGFEDEYSWAPDASGIVFVRTRNGGTDDLAQSIWHMRPNGKRQRRLTSGDLSAETGNLQAYYPTWSLSSHRVAYTRFASDGTASLWVVRTDEDAKNGKPITAEVDVVYTPNWFTRPVELQAGVR